MASLNLCQFIGNLGSDPEVRTTSGGQSVCEFSLACNDSWTDKGGQKQERVEWVRVVAWGKLAELCGRYLRKGRPAYVAGRMATREWQDKEGNKRWTTEIVASQVQFLGSPEGRGDVREARREPEARRELRRSEPPPPAGDDESVPF